MKNAKDVLIFKKHIKMKPITKQKLTEALEYCNNMDKSVEFTLLYLQDYAKVSLDCANEFYIKQMRLKSAKSVGKTFN